MIDKDLENFIYHQTGYQKPIDKDTKIIGKLVVDRAAFSQFMADYANLFDVDISEFDAQEYLADNTTTELTVEDLERGIMLGRINKNIISLKKDEQQLPLKFSWKKSLIGVILLIAITGILIFVAFYA